MSTQTIVVEGIPDGTAPKIGVYHATTGAVVAAPVVAAPVGDSAAGFYAAAFTDIAAGRYRVTFFWDGTTATNSDFVTLELETGTYYGEELLAASGGDVSSFSGDAATQVNRIDTNASGFSSLAAVSTPLPAGYLSIGGQLVIGDDYTSDVGREIEVSLLDAGGAAIDVVYGSHSLADGDTQIRGIFAPATERSELGTLVAAGTYVPASGEDPAKIRLSLPRTETLKAEAVTYDLQIEVVWTGSGSTVTIIPYGEAIFRKNLSDPS